MPVSTRCTHLALLGCLGPVAWLLLPVSGEAQVRVKAEAFRGEPFGVGRVDILLSEQQQPEVLGPVGLGLSEANGRVLYPAVDAGEVGRAAVESVRGVLGESRKPVLRLLADLIPTPPKAEIYFLFQGDEPVELKVRRVAHSTGTAEIIPASARATVKEGDYVYAR